MELFSALNRKRCTGFAAVLAAALTLSLVAGGCILETRKQAPVLMFMGNSITSADSSSTIGWPVTEGMAASSPDKDYVHRTTQMLKDQGYEMRAVLGARDCDTLACDGPIEEHLNNVSQVSDLGARYVVVQLGENSNDVEVASGKLRAQYHALLAALVQQGAKHIYCVSPWAESTLVTPRAKAISLAMEGISNAKLIDITAVTRDGANLADTALFKNIFVRWHPGDGGMNGIATLLSAAILEDRRRE